MSEWKSTEPFQTFILQQLNGELWSSPHIKSLQNKRDFAGVTLHNRL